MLSKTPAVACVTVACASMLAGCGGSRNVQAAGKSPRAETAGRAQRVQNAARGYLYRYGNGEAFIQWQRDGRHVRGTNSTTQITCCAPVRPHLIEESVAVTGTISGSKVLLHYSNGTTWTGTLTPTALLIRSAQRIPAGDPPLPLQPFRRATGADYNAAAAKTKAALQIRSAG
jgi:hypothetical protein